MLILLQVAFSDPCVTPISNCRGCQGQFCDSCELGFYLQQNQCISCPHTNCLSCVSSGCVVCLPMNFLKEGACVSCQTLPQCKQCNSQIKCQYCLAGYWAINGICQKCNPGCDICLTLKTYCFLCSKYYYLKPEESTCAPCTSGCVRCNQYYCQICQFGRYQQYDGSCKPCISNCFVCYSLACISCLIGMQYSEGKCLNCKVGTYLSAASQCQSCQASCISCTATNVCIACSYKWFDGSGNCLCDTGCSFCPLSPSVCINCQNKYFLNKDQCSSCSLLCKYCISKELCLTCDLNYMLKADGNCQKCQNNCLVCIVSSANCISCSPYSFLNQKGYCRDCMAFCRKCQAQNYCSACLPTHYIKDYLCLSCGSCLYGCQYPDQGSTAVCGKNDCSPQCLTCSTINSFCYSCIQSHFLTYEGNCRKCNDCPFCFHMYCIFCYQGYRLQSGACTIICAQGCKSCLTQVVCSECHYSFFLESGSAGICKKCKAECYTCRSYQSCLSCAQNFYFQGLVCKSCQPGCSRCDKDTCWGCVFGYFRQNQRCEGCPQNCAVCFDSHSCAACSRGIYNDTIRACIYIECLQDQYIKDTACQQNCCVDCKLRNCYSCIQLFCFNCVIGYSLMYDEQQGFWKCFQCQKGCLYCHRRPDDCFSCIQSYYWSDYSCIQCGTYCLHCKQDSCYQCQPKYYVGQTSQCVSCQIGCETCLSKLLCIVCSVGYYFKDSGCLTCGSGCQLCTALQCVSCEVGARAMKNEMDCKTCQQGTFYEANKLQCMACEKACATCWSTSYCFTCSASFYLEGSKCLVCYLSCATCSKSDACLTCKADLKFIQNVGQSLCSVPTCQQGKYLNKQSFKCDKCDSKCVACQDQTVCTKCQLNQQLVSGKCSLKSTPQPQPQPQPQPSKKKIAVALNVIQISNSQFQAILKYKTKGTINSSIIQQLVKIRLLFLGTNRPEAIGKILGVELLNSKGLAIVTFQIPTARRVLAQLVQMEIRFQVVKQRIPAGVQFEVSQEPLYFKLSQDLPAKNVALAKASTTVWILNTAARV